MTLAAGESVYFPAPWGTWALRFKETWASWRRPGASFINGALEIKQRYQGGGGPLGPKVARWRRGAFCPPFGREARTQGNSTMADEAELAAIRARRMAQMQRSQSFEGESGQQEASIQAMQAQREQQQQQEQMRHGIISQLLTNEARERRMVVPPTKCPTTDSISRF